VPVALWLVSVRHPSVEKGNRFKGNGVPDDVLNKVLSSKVVADVQHETLHCL
jgi:hypothetical protein